MKTCVGVLLVSLAISALGADEVDRVQNPDPFVVTIKGSFNFGPIEGFLQTPTGGHPGTSSLERPSFDELGIDNVAFYDAGLDLQWRSARLYGGYQFIRVDGTETLSS